MPVLSIITINYNDAAGLMLTMESVRCQTSRDFEWIVIDGGSTDGSVELIRDNADIITYWVSEPDRGIYHAMNKGVDRARGEYLQFLNAGDRLYDENVVGDFAGLGTKADVIYGRAYIVDSAGREMWRWPLPETPLRLSYFWSHSLKHQAAFFSRRCFDRYRYNEDHRINSDTELFMTLLYNGYEFERYDRWVVRFNGEGLSSRPDQRKMMDDEFADTLGRLMPAGMRADYSDVITMRDVDIVRMSAAISQSPRWVRHLTRALIYPVYHLFARK